MEEQGGGGGGGQGDTLALGVADFYICLAVVWSCTKLEKGLVASPFLASIRSAFRGKTEH